MTRPSGETTPEKVNEALWLSLTLAGPSGGVAGHWGKAMKIKLFAAALAGILTVAFAGAGAASVQVASKTANQLAVDQGVLLDNFDGYVAPNVQFNGNIFAAPQNPVTTAAEPPYVPLSLPDPNATIICCDSGGNPYSADATGFESVEGGQMATFSAINGYYLTSFNFYMGSPDTYNHVIFNFAGGGSQSLDGDEIWGLSPPGTGDRSIGFRVYYNFNGAHVSSINFVSDTNAFEGDNFAGTVAIPEPATWAMMIMGFGLAGGMLRARRRGQATA
jgi:hypothetical protein